MTYSSYDRDVRRIFDKAGFIPEVKYYFRDDFAVLSMVQHGLGIGIRSMAQAGPLARFVIHQLQVLTSEPS